MRDYQRSKVYRSEGNVFGLKIFKMGYAEILDIGKTITESKWWANNTDNQQIEICLNNRLTSRFGQVKSGNRVEFGTDEHSLQLWVLLHELAHIMAFEITGAYKHGKTFCHCYLLLIEKWIRWRGNIGWAETLKMHFIENKVDYIL